MPRQADLNTVTEDLIRAFFQFRKLHREEHKPPFDPRHPCHGLKGSEIILLFVLSEAHSRYPEGVPVSELSKTLAVKPPSITPLLAALEEKEMLGRTMDKNDRRIVRVRLLEKGRELVEGQRSHMVGKFRGLVEYLGVEKSVMLTELINEAFVYIKQQSDSRRPADRPSHFHHDNGRGAE